MISFRAVWRSSLYLCKTRAAIRGLNEKLEEQRVEIAELKQRLEKLERLMGQRGGDTK